MHLMVSSTPHLRAREINYVCHPSVFRRCRHRAPDLREIRENRESVRIERFAVRAVEVRRRCRVFFFSLSLFLSPDYVVSPPISLEKGKDARARKNRAGGVLKRRDGRRRRRIERRRVSPRRWTRVLPRCSFASGARGWKRRYSSTWVRERRDKIGGGKR